MPESARWLAEHGHIDDADKVVARFEDRARALCKDLPAPQPNYRSEHRRTRASELFAKGYFSRTILSWILFFLTYYVSYGLNGWIPTLYVKLGGLPPLSHAGAVDRSRTDDAVDAGRLEARLPTGSAAAAASRSVTRCASSVSASASFRSVCCT